MGRFYTTYLQQLTMCFYWIIMGTTKEVLKLSAFWKVSLMVVVLIFSVQMGDTIYCMWYSSRVCW